jgi:hypothetical protein
MFTPIGGPNGPATPVDQPVVVGGTQEDARAYLDSEASLKPMLDFINGAVSKDSIESRETFNLELSEDSVSVEVLNFTGMDVEARVMDPEAFRERIVLTVQAIFGALVEVIKNELENLSGDERKEAEQQVMMMEMMGPMLQMQFTEMLCDEALEAVELVVDGGASRVMITDDTDARVAILPCPEGVSSEKAQAHYYVLRQDMDYQDELCLLAVEKEQSQEETSAEDLAEVIAAAMGLTMCDDDADGDAEDMMEKVMKEVFPQLRFEILLDEAADESNFLTEVENFG